MTIQIIYLIALVILSVTVMFQAWTVYSLNDKVLSLRADVKAIESQRDYFKREYDISKSESAANFGNWQKSVLHNQILADNCNLLEEKLNFYRSDANPNSISSFEYDPKHSKEANIRKINDAFEDLADTIFPVNPES